MKGGPHKDRVEAQGCVSVTSAPCIPLKPNKLEVVELDSRKNDCHL